jgi:hemoglobin-like flavoprotein
VQKKRIEKQIIFFLSFSVSKSELHGCLLKVVHEPHVSLGIKLQHQHIVGANNLHVVQHRFEGSSSKEMRKKKERKKERKKNRYFAVCLPRARRLELTGTMP